MSKGITTIRGETNKDIEAIAELTISAFKALEVSQHTEQFIITALRKAKALSLSLVAEIDGTIVGHIAFSPITISDGTKDWYGLGPVSVLPSHQRKGIGTSLICEGLSRLKTLGAMGCYVVGHPTYYTRFGFENITCLSMKGVPQNVFFALSFDGYTPEGEVAFHPAFQVQG
jgi:putative acetyltransferase